MEKKNKTKWYEDDRFWETFGSVLFDRKHIEAAADEVDSIVKLLDVKPGAKVLDLCCGIGRHCLELARRGYKVTGIDRTESYLEKARERSGKEKLRAEFVKADARQFCQLDEYDAVINMYTAFGYFEDPNEDKRVLLNAYCSLKDGGKLIVDLMGKEVLARIFQERDWREEDGEIFLRETKVSKDWSWAENRWMLLKDGEQKEFRFGHRLYSAFELLNLLKESGFESVNAYGDLDGSDYDQNAKRLIVVATK